MKRLHLHIAVSDLAASRAFYTALLGTEPVVAKPDYLKWETQEPALNLAVSARGTRAAGLNHLGIQAMEDEALAELNGRINAARIETLDEPDAHCCYATGRKRWASDPDGVVWEVFRTMDTARTYGRDRGKAETATRPGRDQSEAAGTGEARRPAGACC